MEVGYPTSSVQSSYIHDDIFIQKCNLTELVPCVILDGNTKLSAHDRIYVVVHGSFPLSGCGLKIPQVTPRD